MCSSDLVSYLEIDEAENMQHKQVLSKLKQYGNREPGPHAVPGLKSGGEPSGKVGFMRTWKMRISETDLHLHHRSLQSFIDTFSSRSADVNNGTKLSLQVNGIDRLPPVKLKVVVSGDQVGFQGATYLASKFFDLKKLGSTDDQVTFAWESTEKVYVCLKSWSKEHVHGLLDDAVRSHMPSHIKH